DRPGAETKQSFVELRSQAGAWDRGETSVTDSVKKPGSLIVGYCSSRAQALPGHALPRSSASPSAARTRARGPALRSPLHVGPPSMGKARRTDRKRRQSRALRSYGPKLELGTEVNTVNLFRTVLPLCWMPD